MPETQDNPVQDAPIPAANAIPSPTSPTPPATPQVPAAAVTVAEPRQGFFGWLFGPWVSGGQRPIVKSKSLRWSVICTIVGAGAWLFSSASSDAPAMLKHWSPAVTGFALSFVVAFFAGFVVRKVLKAVALAALLLAGLFAAAKLAGIKLDTSLLHSTTQQAIQDSKSVVHSVAELAKAFLPSTFAAVVGLWRGGRRDSIR